MNMVCSTHKDGDDDDFPVWEIIVCKNQEMMVAPGDSGVSIGHSKNLYEGKDNRVRRRQRLITCAKG